MISLINKELLDIYIYMYVCVCVCVCVCMCVCKYILKEL